MTNRMTQEEALTLIKCLMNLPEEMEIKQFAVSAHVHESPPECDGTVKVFSNCSGMEVCGLFVHGIGTVIGGTPGPDNEPEFNVPDWFPFD